MKTPALITLSVLMCSFASAGDMQPPVGRFMLATHTDGGSMDVAIAKIEKHDAGPATIGFKYLGAEWTGPMRFGTRTTRLITPEESNSGQVFNAVLATEEGLRTLALSGMVDEFGVLRGKMVFLIGIGVAPGGTQEPTAGTGTFVMRPEQAEPPAVPVSNDPSIESIKRRLPDTISPLTAQQLDTAVPHSYYFDYAYQPQPGKRIWRRIDSNTWHEIYPDGATTVFKVLGHTTVANTEGTIVTMSDGGLQAFIPDLGSATMHHWYRNTARGDTTWNDLAPMKDVK